MECERGKCVAEFGNVRKEVFLSNVEGYSPFLCWKRLFRGFGWEIKNETATNFVMNRDVLCKERWEKEGKLHNVTSTVVWENKKCKPQGDFVLHLESYYPEVENFYHRGHPMPYMHTGLFLGEMEYMGVRRKCCLADYDLIIWMDNCDCFPIVVGTDTLGRSNLNKPRCYDSSGTPSKRFVEECRSYFAF